jgi:ketosteroid isomerase-like protein
MAAKDSKAVVRRYFEEARQDEALIDELFSKDFVFRYEDSPLPLGDAEMRHVLGVTAYDPPDPGRVQLKTLSRLLYTAFPDWRYTIEDLFAERDKVAVRLTAGGTHRGEGFSALSMGKLVTTGGVALLRLVRGQIVEAWQLWAKPEVRE